MRQHLTFRHLGTAASAVLALGLAACSTSPAYNSNSLRAGQESTFHTPQGETGTPHGHGSTAVTTLSPNQMGASGAAAQTPRGASSVGQESSLHTPQGETGTPHRH